jgi:hypothetical protein
MKIEIGESLIFSWLRHVMSCPIVQTNWKPSPTWAIRHEAGLAGDFERMRETARQRLRFEVFRQSTFQQFMRQAEIDVLGLRFNDAGVAAVAVDSAFHEAGVNYGELGETVGRILKKMIRTAFILEAYFDLHQADIVFATPKMHNAVQNALQGCWPELQSVLANCGSLAPERMQLRIVANGDFVEQIIQPVLDQMDQVADTSELFLRAQQLVRFCEVTPRQQRTRSRSAPARSESAGEVKIGEHVRASMLAKAGKLTPVVLEELIDPVYCKQTFNLGHPFLKIVDPAKLPHEQHLDERGYARYWSQPVRVGARTFLACSQWFEPQRPAFDRWLRGLEASKTADGDQRANDATSVASAAGPIRSPAPAHTLK